MRRGPARVVYLAAAVPLRSGGNWFCIARGNWQKNKSAGSRSQTLQGGEHAVGGLRVVGAELAEWV